MNVLESLLRTIDGGRVLDVATGDGEFVALLTENLSTFEEIVGIDTDENLLSDAKRYMSSRTVRFRRADAARLPFAAGEFDTVTMSNALHHMVDPVGALNEIFRVIKEGRPVILQEMVSDNLTEAERIIEGLHEIKAAVDTLLGIPHRRTYSRIEVLSLLEQSQLDVIQTVEYAEPTVAPHNKQDIDARIEFIFDYLEHISDHPREYARHRREAVRIKEQIYRTGIGMPPELVIMAIHRHSVIHSVYST